MDIVWIGNFWRRGLVLICWRALTLWIWLSSFQVQDDLRSDRVSQVQCVCGLADGVAEARFTAISKDSPGLLSCRFLAQVLRLPFKLLGSRMWVQVVRYDLFSVAVFFPCLSILSLSLLGLGSNPTSLNPRLCGQRPRAVLYDLFRVDHFFGFSASSWLIVWMDGLSGCGCCLPRSRDADSRARCSYTSAFPINVNNVMFIVLLKQLWEGAGGGQMGGGWFILGCGRGERVFFLLFSYFCFCASVLCSLVTRVPLDIRTSALWLLCLFLFSSIVFFVSGRFK